MKTKRSEKGSGSKRGNTGFYIALAVCITTIAAAAWTTYGSLADDMTYMSSESSEDEIAAGNDVSGQSYESSAQESSMQKESITESSEENAAQSQALDADKNDSKEQESEEEKLFMPVTGEISKGYSGGELVYSTTTSDWRTHRGVDLKAQSGTAVKAVSDGTVLSIEKNAKLGNIITIDHGDVRLRYCGLTEAAVVKEGDKVAGGAPIGYIGTVPCEQLDGAHLHLEMIVGDTLADPKSLLEKTSE